MRSVTIVGKELRGRPWTPGQHIRVAFRDLSDPTNLLSPYLLNSMRDYSLADYDPENGIYQLVVMAHDGDGPGAKWMRSVQPGDAVVVGPPEGKFAIAPDARQVLLVGEETSFAAFSAMLGALPAGCDAQVVVEAESTADHLDLPDTATVIRVQRDGRPASPSFALEDAVRALPLPEQGVEVYLAGEARTIQRVRRHLINDLGYSRRAIHTKPFRAPGKRGLD
jgi:NADPH-dependent ferric siderophore reductase